MARMKILTSVLALTLATGTSFAQDSSRTINVIQPGQVIDKNIVRAQFIRPGDVSPEEYSRLLSEADRIRSYQSTDGSLATPVTYNAANSASISELTPQSYSEYQTQQTQTYQTPQTVTTYTASTPAATAYTQGQTYYSTSGQSAYQPQYQSAATTQSLAAAPVTTYAAPLYTAPVKTAAYAAPATTYSTPVAAHNVMKGDTLYNISKRYGVALDHLKEANRLTSNIIGIGQILTIPSVQKTASATYTPPATNFQSSRTTQTYSPTQNLGTTYVRNVQDVPRSGVYAVLPKDTLFSISRFACVSPADVAQINGITNASGLQPGQKLTMPAGHCLN